MSLELESNRGDRRTVPFDAPILEALQRDDFDVVLLAAPDGRVLKQSGEADLSLAELGALIASGDSGARTGNTTDVTDLAGTNYRLFMQRCCGRVRVQAEAGRPAAGTTRLLRFPTASPPRRRGRSPA